MQSYDPQKAARVWQRVQGQQENPKIPENHDNYQELLMNEAHSAAVYQQLARKMGQKEAAALQRLARQEHRHAACIRGIQVLAIGERPELRVPQPQTDSAELALRRCYAAGLRSLKAYESRTDDPEYGHVFAELARQERELCKEVLELIGGLGKK